MVNYRPMRDDEADTAAALIRKLPGDIGLAVIPKVTGQSLVRDRDVAQVTIAEDQGVVIAACLWCMTYSSWRSAKGMYVSDLYVAASARGRDIGDGLLRAAARFAAAQGATFIKLEADVANLKAQGFYQRRHFKPKPDDQKWILEPDDFAAFVKG